jgi:DNA-directed RNA polymerase subunit alpha
MLTERLRSGTDVANEPLQPKIDPLESTPTYGRFLIEPLEAGFGTTLGNALRRVLLSSIPGAAITSVKIDQVQHEFSSIPNVREDTTEFLLNVKKINLQPITEQPGRLTLDKRGPGVVTAADIEVSADFNIVNRDLVLAHLDSPDARLNVEFRVEHGKGYVPAQSQREGSTIGEIPVDAIFTPIRKVNYVVEHKRIGGITNYDRLIIEMWTTGAIDPQAAMSKAAGILISLLQLLSKTSNPQQLKPASRPNSDIDPVIAEKRLEDLDLSVRTFNSLRRAQIDKVGEILARSADDLLAVRNFGKRSLDELFDKLAEHGIIHPDYQAGASEDEDEEGDGEITGEVDMFGNPIIDPDEDEDDEE